MKATSKATPGTEAFEYELVDSTNVEKRIGRPTGFDESLARETGPGYMDEVPEPKGVRDGGLGGNTQGAIDRAIPPVTVRTDEVTSIGGGTEEKK